MISIQSSFPIELKVLCAPDRQELARQELDRTRGIIDEFVNGERRRLMSLFPLDDYAQDPSQRRGCCG